MSMRAYFRVVVAIALAASFGTAALAAELTSGASGITGWRGNWTGRFPDATPVTQWSRIPKGIVRELKNTSTKPAPGDTGAQAPVVDDGLVQDWLIAGPFAVSDTAADFDKEQIAGEAALEPSAGDKAGVVQWQAYHLDKQTTGDINAPWVNLYDFLALDAALKTKATNQVAYGFSYVYAPKAGKAVVVAEHTQGMKVCVNGKSFYSSAASKNGPGYYSSLSYGSAAFQSDPSDQRFEVEFKQGWNRLLVKLSSGPKNPAMNVFMRIVEPTPAEYESKNIVWSTRLSDRGNANPIIQGDKMYLTAEPDELVCLDKKTGKILWKRSNNYFDATPEDIRNANPAFKEKIQPLVEKLLQTDDQEQRLALRRQIRDGLIAIDKARYEIKLEDHKVSHFRINGWATPTPVSDGKFIYLWFTHGVAACYELDGKRQWIARVDDLFKDPAAKFGPYSYPVSPVLVDGKLVIWVDGGKVVALDARTGQAAWKNADVKGFSPAMATGVVAGRKVVFISEEMIDAADGKTLMKVGAAPVFQDGTIYRGWGGGEFAMDFTGVSGEPPYKPARRQTQGFGNWHPVHAWAAPLCNNDIVYTCEISGNAIAFDAKTGAKYWEKVLDMHPWTTYNSIGVGAAPAGAGKYVFFMDNQGTCIVVEAGKEFKVVSRNRIETQIHRNLPFSQWENFYASPIFEGKYVYLRGEQNLYCIGEK